MELQNNHNNENNGSHSSKMPNGVFKKKNKIIHKDENAEKINSTERTLENTQTFTSKKLYEMWPGNNKFYCFGFLLHGSKKGTFILLCGIKLIVNGVFFGLVTPFLWQYEIYYFPIMTLILLVFTVALMFLASCIDPGIIPRKNIINLIEDKKKLSLFIKSDEEDRINYETTHYKFCGTCFIYRPPLTAHCLYTLIHKKIFLRE